MADAETELLGPFRILERIGAGGMGVVYLAERREPIEQRVALKVIRTDRLDRTYLARFAMEQSALARMDHPNIARLFDAGESDGQSWYAMEYVPGVPLTTYCSEHRLTIAQRLGLFAQICDGVQHAHMKGILHRDLKPGNILVREVDGRPLAKIIDFGLAQPIDPLQIRATLHEALHSIVGTIAYMSPEQADRIEGDLDIRTDVYSLGVVLYELLTGQLPIDPAEIKRGGLLEVGGLLRAYEPKKPSTRLSEIGEHIGLTAAERSATPAKLRASVRGELDWVTMKAIAADRQQRYATARDLGRDIAHLLQHRPVEAGPPSSWYAVRKWARRHVRGLAATGVLAAGLIAFAIVTASLSAEARAAELRRDILAKGLLAGDYVARADTELWPADGEHVQPMRAWLQETGPLLRFDAQLAEFEAELQREVTELAEGTELEVARSQLRQVAVGRQNCTALVRSRELVTTRVERARTLRERTIVAFEADWAEARRELAEDPRFADFEMPDIPGLVPLGKNSQSGLQEFYLLDSGTGPIPKPGEDGTYEVRAGTGLIFVLIPGGSYGDVAEDRRTLEPFLLARYEMTEAQWVRLLLEEVRDPAAAVAANPSYLVELEESVPGTPTRLEGAPTEPGFTRLHWVYPVQMVSWNSASRYLLRWNLRLPTTAQFYWAANGRAEDRFGFAWATNGRGRWINFNDVFSAGYFDTDEFVAGTPSDEWDGFAYMCPVGALRPNPYGLHSIFGNIGELVRDGEVGAPTGPEQACVEASKLGSAFVLGGCFVDANPELKGTEKSQPLGNVAFTVGLRPTLPLPGYQE